jgi:hypothetical protein
LKDCTVEMGSKQSVLDAILKIKDETDGSIQELFSEIDGKKQRLELNLYVTGHEDDAPDHAQHDDEANDHPGAADREVPPGPSVPEPEGDADESEWAQSRRSRTGPDV